MPTNCNGRHNVVKVVCARKVVVLAQVILVERCAAVRETDNAVLTAGGQPVVFPLPEDATRAVVLKSLHQLGDVLVVAVIDQEVLVRLVFGDVHLGQLVVVERDEMVKVLLKQVEQHGGVGRTVNKFELVRRQFSHYCRGRADAVDDVEERHADVARQQGVASRTFEQMVNQRGRRALAFGACHTDDLPVKGFQKKVGLRGYARRFYKISQFVEIDPRSLEDEVVLVEVLVVTLAFDEADVLVLDLACVEVGVAVGDDYRHVRKMLPDETVGGDTLFAKAEDDNLLVVYLLQNVIG